MTIKRLTYRSFDALNVASWWRRLTDITRKKRSVSSFSCFLVLGSVLMISVSCADLALRNTDFYEPMLQGFVDNVLAVAKESVKTFTYESLNNFVRLINGISALVLAVLPGKNGILEGIHGWELRPTFRGPRLPRWMENGVSSFNQFIHEFSADSNQSSSSDYLSAEEDNSENCPGIPLPQSSRISRASSFSKYDKHSMSWVTRLLSWILWPVTFIIELPFRIYCSFGSRRIKTAPDSLGNPQPFHLHAPKRSITIKDHIVQRATDRRRGVIEDLHLAIEVFIEAVFDIVHKGAHGLLSPSETCQILFRWVCSHCRSNTDISSGDQVVSVPASTLGETIPAPTERQIKFHQSLNTDDRTCRDVITELGYPYEAIRVVTSDGYVLLLERIPRWVSNGVVGSPAFAAYDQGYDVFLGNMRGLVSREHVDKNISSRKYWRYSINEHGTQDIPAMIEKIHQVKNSELNTLQQDSDDETSSNQSYKVCAICHSLGGAAMLMYVITRRLENKPHRLSRLILLSPAGFHEDSSIVFTFVQYMILVLAPILAPIMPGFYIPTRFFRMLLNKLARDFHNYPALGGLVQTLMGYVVGGDSSNWIGVIGLPHYNMYDMPGVSFYVGLHLAQIKRAKRFIMYDFGSASANMEAYGSPEPLDLGACYGLIDVPVDLVAGQKDRVIRRSMVRKHCKLMEEAAVDVSYNEFEYAHLDFTFSHREELLSYVMSRLLLVVPPDRKRSSRKVIRLKKANRNRAVENGDSTRLSLEEEIKRQTVMEERER